jgi:ribosomal protein S18 acetylase RimI-like enzyme
VIRVAIARPVDLVPAARVRVASWRAAFTGLVPQDFLDSMDATAIAAGWSESLAAGRSRLHVARVGDEVVGYAGLGPERDKSAPPGTGELYALFVDPSCWCRGVGRALAEAALADLRDGGAVRVWLWVLEANVRARAFYERNGFVATADRTTSSLGDLPEIRYSRPL